MPHIMIIDDDIHINALLEEALTAEGYIVSKAFSGTEALFVLSKSKPDLLLLVIMLPGLSGEELLPKLRAVPVIVVSAKADTADKVDLLIGGAADYITKPFDIRELLARITVQLRKS
ncbi:MAG: response regulator transcription factor, partial [Ruminiclostridium sp.]|nr:response regulator transcription factor [Ruminiclostridium sp.]